MRNEGIMVPLKKKLTGVDRMKELSEKTMVPLGFAIVLFAGVVWLTTLSNQTQANTAMLMEVRKTQEMDSERIRAMEKTVLRIEFKMGEREESYGKGH